MVKRKTAAGLLIAAMFCVSGCGTLAVSQDTLSLSGDGEVTYTIVSDFPEDQYNLEELRTLAESELASYGDGVSISKAVVEDGILSFQYEFQTMTDYEAFMETKCYRGSVKQALQEGYKPDTIVFSADGKSATLQDESMQEYQLFVFNEPVAVRCDGKVRFYSGNLSLSDKREVVPVSESNGPYYVVYK